MHKKNDGTKNERDEGKKEARKVEWIMYSDMIFELHRELLQSSKKY